MLGYASARPRWPSLVAAFATQALAQPAQTGTIAGEVHDASGAVLPGVTVTITSQERGFVRSAVTDETRPLRLRGGVDRQLHRRSDAARASRRCA